MPDKSDIGIVDCHVTTMWNPDYAFDDTPFHDDTVDSAMLAIRCYEAG
jgi:hypothetical protein